VLDGKPDKSLVYRTDVFWNGLNGYPFFRIPALVQLGDVGSSNLFALAEGRFGIGDAGRIDLVYRQSFDGGRSWEPKGGVDVLSRAGQLGDAALRGGTLGNAVPIYLPAKRRLLVLACSNGRAASESAIRAGSCSAAATRRVWLFSASVDESGRPTWDASARELTSMVKRPCWSWYATGPGAGVVLSNGTIVVPCNHAGGADAGDEGDRSHLIVSHDGGETWSIIDGFAGANSNEATLVQLANGELLLQSRELRAGPRWMHALEPHALALVNIFRTDTLREPPSSGVQAALAAPPYAPRSGLDLFRKSTGPGPLFNSKPDSSRRRERLTIFRSDDGGASWPRHFLVHNGSSAYSSLLFLRGGDKGVGDGDGIRQEAQDQAWWLAVAWWSWVRDTSEGAAARTTKSSAAAAQNTESNHAAPKVPQADPEALGVLFESGGKYGWSCLVEWISFLADSPLFFAQRISFARVVLGSDSPLGTLNA
jgi:sialidase-1